MGASEPAISRLLSISVSTLHVVLSGKLKVRENVPAGSLGKSDGSSACQERASCSQIHVSFLQLLCGAGFLVPALEMRKQVQKALKTFPEAAQSQAFPTRTPHSLLLSDQPGATLGVRGERLNYVQCTGPCPAGASCQT